MSALVYVVGFCVVALAVYVARYSGRLRIESTRVIDAAQGEVRARIADPRRWQEWSPWLADAGGGAGARVDSVPTRDDAVVEQRVRLQRPFPVRARIAWRFVDVGGRTEVAWRLRGRVGFAMRAFAPTVQAALALELRHAIDRLAALVEPAGAPRYLVSFPGVRDIAAMRYAYVAHEGPIDGLAAAIGSAVDGVRSALARAGVVAAGAPVGVYARTDIRRRTTLVHFGLPADAERDVDALAWASRPAHRAFVARLQGSRAQLELAWYLAMQRLGSEGLRPDPRIAPIERYLDGAGDGLGNDAVTELQIATR